MNGGLQGCGMHGSCRTEGCGRTVKEAGFCSRCAGRIRRAQEPKRLTDAHITPEQVVECLSRSARFQSPRVIASEMGLSPKQVRTALKKKAS